MKHTGPGRRFAYESTKEDHILGIFGFVAHGVFFMNLGAGLALLISDNAILLFFFITLILWILLLIIRALQVGTTTTKESIEAIKKAWLE